MADLAPDDDALRFARGRTAIRRVRPEDAEILAAMRAANRAHLEPWEPVRPATFFTVPGQALAIAAALAEWKAGARYAFVVCDAEDRDRPVGNVTVANVVRGAWRSATLGYWVAVEDCGRGHATTATQLAVDFAFGHAGLHRVQAAVLPRNAASARVLEKAGFRREGHALRYLEIAGRWEDHDLYAVTAEDAAPLLP